MFVRKNCDLCGDCLVRCQYLNYSKTEAVKEISRLMRGEKAEILSACVTCSACNEFCEKKANPFDLINMCQEKYGVPPVPEKTAREYSNLTKVADEIRTGEKDGPVISLCSLGDFVPRLFEGQLFDRATLVKGGRYFCHLGMIHIGKPLKKEDVVRFVGNLSRLGSEEIVFYHDECYAVAKVKAAEFGVDVPFRPVHIHEYIYKYLAAHQGKIKKLNRRAAVQRPCGARYTPEKDGYVDLIFELIGVERVKREYDGIHALCCGTPLYYRESLENIEELQKKNIADAKDNGAGVFVFSCPICLMNMRRMCLRQQIEPASVIRLCREALGEQVSRFTI
ncbi:MAG: (Fe-S)-binding protein [Peptococcaceae bacterium]|jgi:Fe-S oxidoreductase|nr:(Fe-S)-binding protein [Peptococcaceae bacterium]MDH7524220.1 (Fe-S)-binding protein [Peptococcaceae bacterium]